MPSISSSDPPVLVKTPDGRTAFFPWGVFGPGYVIGPDADLARLRWPISKFAGALLAVGIAATRVPLIVGLFLLAFFVFHTVWTLSRLRGLQSPLVRLTLREGLIAQARARRQATWGLLTFLMLALAGIGVFVMLVDRSHWLLTACMIVFSGLIAATGALLFVVRWWTSLRELQSAPVKLTLREALIVQARAGDQATWALLTFLMVTLAAVGVMLMLHDRSHWLLAACTIVVFGLLAATGAVVLVVRWRTPSEHSPRDAV